MQIKDSIWFFDIDDTLIDMAGCTLEGAGGIYNVFKSKQLKPNQLKLKIGL